MKLLEISTVLLVCFIPHANCLVPPSPPSHTTTTADSLSVSLRATTTGRDELAAGQHHPRPELENGSRRKLLVQTVFAAGAAFVANSVQAAEPTIWRSGKSPIVPGQKPKDKSNVSGTRKDPSFLRSVSDCKSQCEATGKTRDDCLSECQDICCTTYEQCTFAIVPRI